MAQIVSNVVAIPVIDKQTGDKKYDVFNFKTDDGQVFEKVYHVPKGFSNGMEVEITSKKGKYGQEHTVTEAGSSGSSKPASSGGAKGKSDVDWAAKDDRIARMSAINSALAFMALAMPGFSEKVKNNPDLLLGLTFEYANLMEKAASDGEVFKEMPQFTGDINTPTEEEKVS